MVAASTPVMCCLKGMEETGKNILRRQEQTLLPFLLYYENPRLYKAVGDIYLYFNGVFPGSCSGDDMLTCDDYFYIDNFSGTGIITEKSVSYISIVYCPGAVPHTDCAQTRKFVYRSWLDQSSSPNERVYWQHGRR